MPASSKLLSKVNELGKAVSLVLAKWHKDSLYYQVEILSCDEVKRSCKVKFEDKSVHTIDCKNLHIQLALEYITDDDLIVCSVCDLGKSDPPNQIVICDTCQQGYHMKCHRPRLDQSVFDDETAEWICSVCSELTSGASPKKPSKGAVEKVIEKKKHKELVTDNDEEINEVSDVKDISDLTEATDVMDADDVKDTDTDESSQETDEQDSEPSPKPKVNTKNKPSKKIVVSLPRIKDDDKITKNRPKAKKTDKILSQKLEDTHKFMKAITTTSAAA